MSTSSHSHRPTSHRTTDVDRMAGHWLLAQVGKRVLRPGGLELTRRMLELLKITPNDALVEFAPGLGITAKLALEQKPQSYTAIEEDEIAAKQVERVLDDPRYTCVLGTAEETGLESESATVVYAEAMLTMQSPNQKERIVQEAFRVLKPGGRYGIHEMALAPDSLADETKRNIQQQLAKSIRVNARPLTVQEWRELLEKAGFVVENHTLAPMHLLEPKRMIEDEGLFGVARMAFNLLRKPDIRRRVLNMRAMFKANSEYLRGVTMVAYKPTNPQAEI